MIPNLLQGFPLPDWAPVSTPYSFDVGTMVPLRVAPRTSDPPRRSDLDHLAYRWFECEACGARVPVWGAGDGHPPAHCHSPSTNAPYPMTPVSTSGLEGPDWRECRLCGCTFARRIPGRRGHPREWCSEDCLQAHSALNRFEALVGRVADRATPERWLNIRSRLQGRLALRAWNRGVGRAR